MTAVILAILSCALWLLVVLESEKIPEHIVRMTLTDDFGRKITFVNCTFYPQKGQP
jgi:hypothetical protein